MGTPAKPNVAPEKSQKAPTIMELRGCLKTIEKFAYSLVLSEILLSRSVKIRNFEQYVLWLGQNSQF